MTEDKIQPTTTEDSDKAQNPQEAHESQEITLKETIKKIKEQASEDDPKPSSQLSLRSILCGELLTTQTVRSQIWLFTMIVAFTTIYVAFRYQCQQDMLAIDRLEEQLKDAKFKALSSSSTLNMSLCSYPLPFSLRAILAASLSSN